MYGFLGIGQFGGNITRRFEEAGYPCIVANSSREDLSTVKNAKNKFHFREGQGCHKDRKQSKKLLQSNLETLINEIKTKMPGISTLFICASSSGGTGSGMLAAISKIVRQVLNIRVCIVTVLPSKSENFQSYANTVELFAELEKLEDIGAMFILDNSKHTDKLKINDFFFTHLDALLSNENGSDYGCLDRSEIDQLLSTSGMAVITKLGKDKADRLVPAITENNVYAPIEQNKVIKYISMTSTSRQPDLGELYSAVGIPIDTYIGTNASANVCMLAGLSLPVTRLNEIRAMAQTSAETIKKNMETATGHLFDQPLDFLDVFAEKKQPEQQKNVSSLDILNEFL